MIDVADTAGFFLDLDLMAEVVDQAPEIGDHRVDFGDRLLPLIDLEPP
jgi:hypothetical protein